MTKAEKAEFEKLKAQLDDAVAASEKATRMANQAVAERNSMEKIGAQVADERDTLKEKLKRLGENYETAGRELEVIKGRITELENVKFAVGKDAVVSGSLDRIKELEQFVRDSMKSGFDYAKAAKVLGK